MERHLGEPGFLEQVWGWVSSRPWFPCRGADYRVVGSWSRGRITHFVVEACGYTLYLPLIRVREKPGLPPGYYARVGDDYVYEAGYSSEYYESILLDEQFAVEGRVPKVAEVRPVEGVYTNLVALLRSRQGLMVAKTYRVVEPPNPEPLLLDLLWKAGYRAVPRLVATVRARPLNDVAVIVEEHVGGVEGAHVFAGLLESYIEGEESLEESGRLAERLGRGVGGLHRVLANCGHPEVGPYDIEWSDVELWRRRLSSRISLLRRLGSGKPWSGFLPLVEEAARRAAGMLEMFVGRRKMLLHQDLHLYQTLYSESRGFVFIDFEGEPGRGAPRLSREPPARDLACMIRSFNYLVVERLASSLGGYTRLTSLLRGGRLGKRLVERLAVWEEAVVEAFLEGYVRVVEGLSEEIHGVPSSELAAWLREAVKPWIVERGLYEALYEYTYRPEAVAVPLLGISAGLRGF